MRNLSLVITVSEVQRAALQVRQTRLVKHLHPDFEAPSGQGAQWPQRLADRPEHAEIANGRSGCACAALQYGHSPATPRQMIRMRQAHDTRSDYDVVCHFLACNPQ